ncbi:hypothetical protein AUQ48_14410 [Kocuria flava]|uniref:HTH lysR-type domain-containing protein n=1 Tax=Kocuria flava TaxID=446860 RepID=A0A2N4T4M9_9MICC|nr:LysR family transcriptional regulator [Kocuria flava]MCJ8504315.1 LysR family transcriptional regulator [Kocuria flava]MCJ8504358.1 LysR family transcriptional regulator [Kocuria flava]PLC13188.1 hypothetical protein AUQ48_14410 [Kocuria flava]
MEIDLECVAGFVVLCEEGHFGRAAARLHLTSSALTKRVQRLEKQLDVALLERDATGSTSLTAAGWSFARLAEALLDQARAVQDTVRTAGGPLTERTVRLGLPGAFDVSPYRPVWETLHRLARTSPERITVQCVGVPYTRPLDHLGRGLIDVLWSPSPVVDHDFDSHRLGTTLRVGVVAPDHPLAGQGEVAATDFAKHPVLFNPGVPSALMSHGYLADVRPLTAARLVPTTAQTLAALRADVVQHRGVAVLPFLLAVAAGPEVECVILREVEPTHIWAIRRRADHRPEVQVLLKLLRVSLSRPGPRDAIGAAKSLMSVREPFSGMDRASR